MAPTYPECAAEREQIIMEARSIDEVYEKNDAVGRKLTAFIESLDDATVCRLPDGEKWTIANVVEHVSLVESNMIKICSKLLGKAEAENMLADGNIAASDTFKEKAIEIATMKLEAPQFVQPTCEATLQQSMEKFSENREKLYELKSQFEKFDSNGHRFPHPFLGDLSAGEWLMLIGGHKLRHLKQIEKLAAME